MTHLQLTISLTRLSLIEFNCSCIDIRPRLCAEVPLSSIKSEEERVVFSVLQVQVVASSTKSDEERLVVPAWNWYWNIVKNEEVAASEGVALFWFCEIHLCCHFTL